MKVFREGPAMRVVFFYPGEEGTYLDQAYVTLYENGMVHIRSRHEETTTHLKNCEILWTYQTEKGEKEDRASSVVRLLHPRNPVIPFPEQ